MMETKKHFVIGKECLDVSVGLDFVKRKLGFEFHDQGVLSRTSVVARTRKDVEHFLVVGEAFDVKKYLAGDDLVEFIVKGNGSR